MSLQAGEPHIRKAVDQVQQMSTYSTRTHLTSEFHDFPHERTPCNLNVCVASMSSSNQCTRILTKKKMQTSRQCTCINPAKKTKTHQDALQHKIAESAAGDEALLKGTVSCNLTHRRAIATDLGAGPLGSPPRAGLGCHPRNSSPNLPEGLRIFCAQGPLEPLSLSTTWPGNLDLIGSPPQGAGLEPGIFGRRSIADDLHDALHRTALQFFQC
jgi:hypothetical protein